MPNRSKQKGSRFELELVHMAEAAGRKGYRIPLSGGASIKGDICIAGRTLECKKRASGFVQIRKWKQGFDGVVIGADREEPLIVITYKDWLQLI